MLSVGMKHKVTAAIVLAWSILITIPALGSPDKPSRADSEKAIRKSAYEMMKAFLTNDVATFKHHSAKRTLDLIDLAYEAARQDPVLQQELQKAHIANADQFLGYFMLGMANQYLQAMPLSPEAAALKVANDSTLSFITDADARIGIG